MGAWRSITADGGLTAAARVRRVLLAAGGVVWLTGRVRSDPRLQAAGGAGAAAGALLALRRRVLGRRRRHAAGPAQVRLGDGDRELVDAVARQLVAGRLGAGASEAGAVAVVLGARTADTGAGAGAAGAGAAADAVGARTPGTPGGDRVGMAFRGAGALDATAVVEIGSVSKTFTGVLLADLAAAEVVGLEDPVGRFVAGLPARVAAIRLLDLATHTSGLPRLPGGLLAQALAVDLPDPYADWDAERLERSLRRVRVRRRRAWRYSNLGAGLLGQALERAAGEGWDELVRERICRPLGMERTAVAPVDASEWTPGHDGAGLPAAPWQLAAFAGAGALRSTVADLERWVRAQLDPAATPLGPALETAQRGWRDAPGGQRIGLGWLLRTTRDGRTVHWHNGGTGGFGAFVAFERAACAGVALVETRTHRAALDAAGVRLLDAIAAPGS